MTASDVLGGCAPPCAEKLASIASLTRVAPESPTMRSAPLT